MNTSMKRGSLPTAHTLLSLPFHTHKAVTASTSHNYSCFKRVIVLRIWANRSTGRIADATRGGNTPHSIALLLTGNALYSHKSPPHAHLVRCPAQLTPRRFFLEDTWAASGLYRETGKTVNLVNHNTLRICMYAVKRCTRREGIVRAYSYTMMRTVPGAFR